jgi:2-keto-4-pentenoate hydratase/2-oxohepta-3-ene-1,7-dioic acid hydratase in catechol pathway
VTVVNDVSARDVQLTGISGGKISDPTEVVRGKTYPSFKPIGPGLVTVDELSPPLDLGITTWVNGQVRQQARTIEMIFGVEAILEAVSATVALEIGDVVLTGTPSGVALATGNYLRVGDVVEVEIEGIGRLRNEVVGASCRLAR